MAEVHEIIVSGQQTIGFKISMSSYIWKKNYRFVSDDGIGETLIMGAIQHSKAVPKEASANSLSMGGR